MKKCKCGKNIDEKYETCFGCKGKSKDSGWITGQAHNLTTQYLLAVDKANFREKYDEVYKWFIEKIKKSL